MNINTVNAGTSALALNQQNPLNALAAPKTGAAAEPTPTQQLAQNSASKQFMSAVQQTLSQMGLSSTSDPSNSDSVTTSATATSTSADIASNPALAHALHAFLHNVVTAANQSTETQEAVNKDTSTNPVANAYSSTLSNRLENLAQSMSNGTGNNAVDADSSGAAYSQLQQQYQSLFQSSTPGQSPAQSTSNSQDLQAFMNNLARNMDQMGLGTTGNLISTHA